MNRYRRAADFTALRLGRAVLAYLAVMVAIITLAPFRFESAPVHGLTTIWNWQDLVLNVLMFVPFGFVYQLTRPRGTPANWARVLLLGAGTSAAIEVAQLFSAERYTSLLDLATNTSGALLGAIAFRLLATRVQEDDTVRSLALELPLMGLVYLLIPLCWLIGLGSEGELRGLLVVVPALMAGAILGTVHAGHVRPDARPMWPGWLIATSVGWSLVALLPGAMGDLTVALPGTALTLATALLRDIGTRHAMQRSQTRRVELPTLRLLLPMYAAYLACSALWPLTGASPVWHGTLALALPGVEMTQPFVYRALEQVAAFTLVGYMAAEYRGRERGPRARTLRGMSKLVAWSAAASILLQTARGFSERDGASLSLLLLTLSAAAVGHWLYLLQRAHVRALVQRRALLERLSRAARDAAAEYASRPGSGPDVGVDLDLDEIFVPNELGLHHGVRGENMPEALTVRAGDRLPIAVHVADEHTRAHDIFKPSAE